MSPDEPTPDPDWVRRRRLALVFGDVLPDQTKDELSEGVPTRSDADRAGKGDDWYREQVPPHHG